MSKIIQADLAAKTLSVQSHHVIMPTVHEPQESAKKQLHLLDT